MTKIISLSLLIGFLSNAYASPANCSTCSLVHALPNVTSSYNPPSNNETGQICWSKTGSHNPFPSPPECDVRLWVRSEDLRPSTVIEGDVRLFNNLTGRSAQDCDIISWSLGLRFREIGSFQFLTGRPTRPASPAGLNLTDKIESDDGSEDQDIPLGTDQLVFGRIKETVRDESRELRKQWDLDLGKWSEKVREWEDEKAYYALQNETTVFENLMDMGRPQNTHLYGESNQNQISSFGVAVPSTNFPPRVIRTGGYSWRSDQFIESSSESRMHYFARVFLSNGSTIEIDGGTVNFLPLPQTEQALIKNDELDRVSKEHILKVKKDFEFEDEYQYEGDDVTPYQKSDRDSGWKLILSTPPNDSFVQGRNYTLKGRIATRSANETRLPVALSVKLETTSFDHWTIESLTDKLISEEALDIDVDLNYSGKPANATEALAKAALAVKKSNRDWSLPKQGNGALQLSNLLHGHAQAPKEEDAWELEGSIEVFGTPRIFGFENETLSHLKGNSDLKPYDFEFQLSIPSDTLPSHVTSFKTVISSLSFKLKTIRSIEIAYLNLRVLKEQNISPTLSEIEKCKSSHDEQFLEFDQELSAWLPDRNKLKDSSEVWKNLFKTKHCNSWGDIDGELQGECPETDVDISIIPKDWNEPKRTIELENRISTSELSKKRFAPFHYSREAKLARSPVLVQGSKGDLLRAVDLVVEEGRLHERLRSAASTSVASNQLDSMFPTISNISKPNVTSHHQGLDRWKRDDIKRKLGEEHLTPQDNGKVNAPLWGARPFPARSLKLVTPNAYDFPPKKGSAALDINLAWAENVMLGTMKRRKSDA